MSWYELRSFIGVIIIYQGFQFALSLLLHKTGKLNFNIILALILLALSFNFLNILLLNYGLFNINFGPFYGLIYGPSFFLYTKALIYAEWKFRKNEALHFIPASLSMVAILIYPDLLLSEGINQLITMTIGLQIGVYLLLAYKKVIWFQKSLKNLESDIIKINLSWLKFMIISIAVIFVIVIVEATISNYAWLDQLTLLILYIFVLIFLYRINHKGLKQPEIFNGVTEKDVAINKEIENKYSSSNLKEPEAKMYIAHLSKYMLNQKPYLDFELNLNNLAERTNIPARHLSQILNDRYYKNFFDFINGFRIERAKKLLAEKTNNLRVNEVMYEAGFNSKSTFNHVFKKEVGCTPSAYRNNLK